MSKGIAIGGLMTAATLLAAFLYQRRRILTNRAENLFDACEGALKRIGPESKDAVIA